MRGGPRCTVLNVRGGRGIDLNEAELVDAVTQLNVYSIMGGAEVLRGRKPLKGKHWGQTELSKGERQPELNPERGSESS